MPLCLRDPPVKGRPSDGVIAARRAHVAQERSMLARLTEAARLELTGKRSHSKLGQKESSASDGEASLMGRATTGEAALDAARPCRTRRSVCKEYLALVPSTPS